MARSSRIGRSVVLFSCVAGVGICAPAIARGDSFEGPYAGLAIGYGQTSVKEGSALWSQVGQIDYIGTGGENSSATGAIGGIRLGYDWRFDRFTFGVDVSGDLPGGSADGTVLSFDQTTGSASDRVASSTRLKSIIAIKPKFGLVLDDQTRVYGMAGIAMGRVSRTITGLPGTTGDVFLDPGVSDSSSRQMTGYAVGLGAERIIAGRFSLTLEFNYVDFGSRDFSYGGTTFGIPSNMVQSVKVTNSATTLGLIYRF